MPNQYEDKELRNKIREILDDTLIHTLELRLKDDIPALADDFYELITQKQLEVSFPFKETYDFLYNNHKDVLEELEEHLAETKQEGKGE